MTEPAEVLSSSANPDFTVGRGGLKLPVTEWCETEGPANIATFFRRLWVINHVPRDFYSRSEPRGLIDRYGQYTNQARDGLEFVSPQQAKDKPLLVVRGGFTPDQSDNRPIGLRYSVTRGREYHQIFGASSIESGQYGEIMEMSSVNRGSWEGSILGQSFTRDHEWGIDEEQDRAYEDSLKAVLAGVIELLT